MRVPLKQWLAFGRLAFNCRIPRRSLAEPQVWVWRVWRGVAGRNALAYKCLLRGVSLARALRGNGPC
eukprot:7174726-Prorocentrum_lima.AAC.1